MKRKTTELEKILLDDSWYLTQKDYTGKHSEKTLSYEYTKCVPYENELGFQAIVKLNANRDKIINVGISNVCVNTMTREDEQELHCKFLFLQDYVAKLVSKPCAVNNVEIRRTLDDLDLTPKEKFRIEKITGTNDLDKLANTNNLLVKLLLGIKATQVSNIIKVLVQSGVIKDAKGMD